MECEQFQRFRCFTAIQHATCNMSLFEKRRPAIICRSSPYHLTSDYSQGFPFNLNSQAHPSKSPSFWIPFGHVSTMVCLASWIRSGGRLISRRWSLRDSWRQPIVVLYGGGTEIPGVFSSLPIIGMVLQVFQSGW